MASNSPLLTTCLLAGPWVSGVDPRRLFPNRRVQAMGSAEMLRHEIGHQRPVLVDDVVADVVALWVADPPLRAARLLVGAVGVFRRDQVVPLAVDDQERAGAVAGDPREGRAPGLFPQFARFPRAPAVH